MPCYVGFKSWSLIAVTTLCCCWGGFLMNCCCWWGDWFWILSQTSSRTRSVMKLSMVTLSPLELSFLPNSSSTSSLMISSCFFFFLSSCSSGSWTSQEDLDAADGDGDGTESCLASQAGFGAGRCYGHREKKQRVLFQFFWHFPAVISPLFLRGQDPRKRSQGHAWQTTYGNF